MLLVKEKIQECITPPAIRVDGDTGSVSSSNSSAEKQRKASANNIYTDTEKQLAFRVSFPTKSTD